MTYFWEQQQEIPWWLCDYHSQMWSEWGEMCKDMVNSCGQCRKTFYGDR